MIPEKNTARSPMAALARRVRASLSRAGSLAAQLGRRPSRAFGAPGLRCLPLRQVCLAVSVLAGIALLNHALSAAVSYPYDKTEHGGTDVNGDLTTGAARPANKPVAGYTVDHAKFPPGECIHCHDSHASSRGVPHAPNSTLLFQAPENQLCSTCHDVAETPTFKMPGYAGWAGVARTDTFGNSKHGSTSDGAVWVRGTAVDGIAHVLNNNETEAAIPPGAKRAYAKGSCLACHSAHGYDPGSDLLSTLSEGSLGVLGKMLVRTMGAQVAQPGRDHAGANALCNYCHDNTGLFAGSTPHDLASKSFWYKGSQGPNPTYSGYNATVHKSSASASNLFPGSADYPARTGEKGLCLNCHDPHGGAPGSSINGAGTPASNRMLVAPMIGATERNTLCLTCHSTFAGTGTQKFVGQSLYQNVRHGSSTNAYWGNTTDPFDGSATNYNAGTAYWGPRSSGDYGLCVNCHNPHTKTVGTATVNGSTTIPNELVDSYHNGNSTGVSGYAADNSKLCFDCHNEARLTSADNSNRSTRFLTPAANLHGTHMKGAGRHALCNDCHNPHGYNATQILGTPPAGSRSISFNTAVVTASAAAVAIGDGSPVTTSGPVWYYDTTVAGTPNQTGCLLSCHGHDHNPLAYTTPAAGSPAAEATVLVASEPQPTAGADSITVSLDSSSAGGVEYAVDSTGSTAQTADTTTATRLTRAAAPARPTPRTAFRISAATWTPRSSHAVYVRTKRPGGGKSGWSGTMISVTADANAPCVTYYLDEKCTQPVPTPDGTPQLPTRGSVTVKVQAPSAGSYTLNVQAPGELNDLEKETLRALSSTEAVATWSVAEGTETAGRARVTLTTPEGRTVLPAAGAYAFVGATPRERVFLEPAVTPNILDADGKSTARVTVKVTDANGHALPSRPVDFRRLSGGGSLLPQVPASDPAGVARALYSAGVTAETAEIEVVDRSTGASARTYVRLRVTGTATIALTDPSAATRAALDRVRDRLQAEDRIHLRLEAYPRRLPADGLSTSNIIAVATDGRGLPKQNVMLRFEVASENGQVIATRPVTDVTGRAQAVYVAGKTPGDVTLTASDPIRGASAAITLTLTGSGVAKVIVEASPNSLLADGRSVSQITVRVTDLLRRPVSGATVELRTRNGYGVILAGDRSTNPLGEVMAAFHAGQQTGIETIIATVTSAVPGEDVAPARATSRSRSLDAGGAGAPSLLAFATSDTPDPAAPSFSGMPAGEGDSSGFSPARILAPVVGFLRNFAFGFGRSEEFLTLNGPEGRRRSVHLENNSWSVRFRRPEKLKFGGITATIDMDNDGTAAYGIVNRATNLRGSVNLARRHYDLRASFNHAETKSDDLRNDRTLTGSGTDSLLSLTLRPPGLPIFNVSRYQGDYGGSTGGSSYGYGYGRTTISAFKDFGPFGLRWTNLVSEQNRGAGSVLGDARSTMRYNTIGLSFSKSLLPGIGLDFALNRTGTRTGSGVVTRETNQTNSSVQLRVAPTSNLSISGTHTADDTADSLSTIGSQGTASKALDVSYQPMQFLSLNASLRGEDQGAGRGVKSHVTTRSVGGGLMLTPGTMVSVNAAHTQEPIFGPSGEGRTTDSRSAQFSARLTRGTDLLLGWNTMHGTSLAGTSDIDTYNAQIQSLLARNVRAVIGTSFSRIDGSNEGLPFGLTNRSQDLNFIWTPNQRTDLSYGLSRQRQRGRDSESDSLVYAFRLSTALHSRARLVFEAGSNVVDQTLLLPGGYGQSLRGSRLAARVNYALSNHAYTFLELEGTKDDASRTRTRRLRMGGSLGF